MSQRSRLRVQKVICNLSNYWKWGLSQPCGLRGLGQSEVAQATTRIPKSESETDLYILIYIEELILDNFEPLTFKKMATVNSMV